MTTALLLAFGLLAPAPSPIEGLVGDWDGHAPLTPAGPMDYDLRFARDGEGLRAVAKLVDGVEHHWHFVDLDQPKPALRFMSSFGGQREWMRLPAVVVEAERVVFERAKGAPLRVTVRRTDAGVRFAIELRGQPHVRIELKRR